MGPTKKYFTRKKSKASPSSSTRESSKETPAGRGTAELLALLPPPSSLTGSFRELLQSIREYLSKSFPKLTHLLDVRGAVCEKAKLLPAEREEKLPQAQAGAARAQSRQALSESDSTREGASKLLQVALGSLSTDSAR